MSDDVKPNPGDLDIETLTLINFDGSEQWDLGFMCSELNIYEDISSPFIRGDIVIEDALSLVTRLPIIGEEKLKVKIKTRSYNQSDKYKPIEYEFQIISCIKLAVLAQVRNTRYKLDFVSKERIADLTKVVDDALGPDPVSKMAEKIAKDYLDLEGEKLEVEESVGQQKFVIPMMTPFETMAFLASEAKSQNHSKNSNYLFFQTHEKSYFTTIDELIKKGKIKEIYFTTPQNIPRENGDLGENETSSNAGKRNPIDFRTMVSVQFEHNFNVETNLRMGMYDNTVLTIDPILKQFRPVDTTDTKLAQEPAHTVGGLQEAISAAEKIAKELGLPDFNVLGGAKTPNFNYDKRFFDFEHVYKGRNPNVPDLNVKTANKLISQKSPYKNLDGKSHIRYLITNKEQPEMSPNFDVADGRDRPDFLPWIISFGGQFRSIVCNLVIPGDSERCPGDLIYFDLHEFGATDDIKDKLNEYLSGAYFVIAVRHKYTRGAAMKYTTTIQCVKNSFEKEIENDKAGKQRGGN